MKVKLSILIFFIIFCNIFAFLILIPVSFPSVVSYYFMDPLLREKASFDLYGIIVFQVVLLRYYFFKYRHDIESVAIIIKNNVFTGFFAAFTLFNFVEFSARQGFLLLLSLFVMALNICAILFKFKIRGIRFILWSGSVLFLIISLLRVLGVIKIAEVMVK
jgi:hypothetical protein